MSLQREDISVRVAILIGAEIRDVGNTVDVATLFAEVRCGDDVEGYEARHRKQEQERDTDNDEESFAEGVPLSKGDVRDKYDGRDYTKQKATCRGQWLP